MIPTLYRGSVKDLLGPIQVKGQAGKGLVFQYSDAYSVFDWGRMPDALPGKGKALAVMAADLFEKLERGDTWREFSRSPVALELRKGVSQIHVDSEASGGESLATAFNGLGEKLQAEGLRTHYLGLVGEGDFATTDALHTFEPTRLGDLKTPTRNLVARQVSVARPKVKAVMGRAVVDYGVTHATPAPRLVPVEVIFRFGCPPGSSLVKRVERDPGYLKQLPIPKNVPADYVKAGARWEFPLLELTTKLETSDRVVLLTEALAISGIRPEQMQELMLKTVWVAGWLKAEMARLGVELADGKLEWAVTESGEVMLVDAIGPDELRLLAPGGVQLSKEFLRGFYRPTHWYESVESAKAQAPARGLADWKRLVPEPPPALSPQYRELGAQIYLALANALTGRVWFQEAWGLSKLIQELREGPRA